MAVTMGGTKVGRDYWRAAKTVAWTAEMKGESDGWMVESRVASMAERRAE